MAPVNQLDWHSLYRRMPQPEPVPSTRTSPPTRSSMSSEGGFLEAWAQGYNVGSLIILILIVFCNYRSGIWLHKFILLELVLALWHGTFIFFDDPVYGWYLSATATLLFISYFLHNIVSWLKIRPFLPIWGSRAFIISLLCVQPFWVAEAWSNFAYFNSLGSTVNIQMRPWEALLRDPWWIFTTWKLVDAIKKTYNYRLWALIRINSRFGVMLGCMFISIGFLVTDVIISAAKISANSGINPYWRFALVFKCASDTIFLDDFKSVLDDIMARKFSSENGTVHRGSIPGSGRDSGGHKRSHSGVRRADLMECSSITNPYPVPMATDIYSPQQTGTSRSRYINPFASKKARAIPPRIHVQKETTVTSESRHSSPNGWNSESEMLSRPENAVYGTPNTKRNHVNGSEGSLLIGRLGVDV